MSFQCQVSLPENISALTVGQIFYLDCQGEWPPLFDLNSYEYFPANDTQKFALKILGAAKKNETDYRFIVTSYQTGQVDFPDLVLAHGESRFHLGPVKFEVTSVLEQTEVPQEPYPAFGPLSLSYPTSWILTSAFLFVFLLAVVLRWVWKKIKQQKFKAALMQKPEFENPIRSVSKTLRRLRKRSEENADQNQVVLLKELHEQIDLYFSCCLVVDWSQLSFSKQKKHLKSCGLKSTEIAEFSVLRREIFTGQKKAIYAKEDFKQILEQSLKFIELFEKKRGHEK